MSDYPEVSPLDEFSEMMKESEPYVPSIYPDDDDDYLDHDNQSETSDNSQEFSKIKKNKKKKKKTKADDIGYRKIKNKNGEVEYFSTVYYRGAKIRDPIHGRFIDYHQVGTQDEDLYYKVTYAGIGCKGNPDQLFYDNPEQLENHMNCRISTKNKQLWADKYQLALRKIESRG